MSIYHGPFVSHMMAKNFSKKFNIPWLALIKDYWSIPHKHQNAYLYDLNLSRIRLFLQNIKHTIRRYQETSILKYAKILVPHCEPIAEYLSNILPAMNIKILSNCFDDDDFHDFKRETLSNPKVFRAVCMGAPVTDEPYHALFKSLAVLNRMSSIEKTSFRVQFIGNSKELMESYAAFYSCQEIVDILPHVDHDKAMEILNTSTCLLFPNRGPTLARKLPEYMAAKKPILVFPYYQDSASQKILEKYGISVIAHDHEDIERTLYDWYRIFMEGGNLTENVNEDLVNTFKASNRALELQELLGSIIQ